MPLIKSYSGVRTFTVATIALVVLLCLCTPNSHYASESSLDNSLIVDKTPETTAVLPSQKQHHVLDFDVTLVAVVSMMRSSSTFLSHQILAGMPADDRLAHAPPLSSCPYRHFLSLNEIFQTFPEQSGDAWSVDGEGLLEKGLERGATERATAVKQLTAAELSDFVVRVARRRCHSKIERDLAGVESWDTDSCSNLVSQRHECIVNFKQFDTHLTEEQHGLVWKQLPNIKLIILERDVKQRWKSFWFANESGDWDVLGGKTHKQRLSQQENEVPDVPDWFESRHVNWYNFVRHLLTAGGRLDHISSMDISYDLVVEDPSRVRADAVKFIFG